MIYIVLGSLAFLVVSPHRERTCGLLYACHLLVAQILAKIRMMTAAFFKVVLEHYYLPYEKCFSPIQYFNSSSSLSSSSAKSFSFPSRGRESVVKAKADDPRKTDTVHHTYSYVIIIIMKIESRFPSIDYFFIYRSLLFQSSFYCPPVSNRNQ